MTGTEIETETRTEDEIVTGGGTRSAIEIRAEDEDEEWIHWFGAGGSTNSSSERILTVGLGTVEEVDITVTFPTGIQVTETGVQSNQRITIVEDI